MPPIDWKCLGCETVRLVALSRPSVSVFYSPDGEGIAAQPLLDSAFWFGPRPGEVV